MARPSSPVQVTNFTAFSAGSPDAHISGADLDAEYAAFRASIDEILAWLIPITEDNGTIKHDSIGEDQLLVDFLTQLQADVDALMQPYVDSATTQASNAATSANSASTSANTASNEAAESASHAGVAENARDQAAVSSLSAISEANAAASAKVDAENAQGHAEGAEAQASIYEQQAYEWAEKITGPVQAVPPGEPYPEAPYNSMWSAKWWALYARNTMGHWADLYLGAHEDPPTEMLDGDPLVVGAMYYNTSGFNMQLYDGSAWGSVFSSPAPSVSLTLYYRATAAQTDFGAAPDDFGNTLAFTYSPTYPAIAVHMNGIKLFLDDGTGLTGDYTIDGPGQQITLLAGAPEDATVEIELYVAQDDLRPGRTEVHGLRDIDLEPGTGTPGWIDGVHDTFELRDNVTNDLVIPSNTNELLLSLDGVMQDPDVDYTILGSTVVFNEPVFEGTRFWGSYIGANGGAAVLVADASVTDPALASGTFTAQSGEVVTVLNGLITSIV